MIPVINNDPRVAIAVGDEAIRLMRALLGAGALDAVIVVCDGGARLQILARPGNEALVDQLEADIAEGFAEDGVSLVELEKVARA